MCTTVSFRTVCSAYWDKTASSAYSPNTASSHIVCKTQSYFKFGFDIGQKNWGVSAPFLMSTQLPCHIRDVICESELCIQCHPQQHIAKLLWRVLHDELSQRWLKMRHRLVIGGCKCHRLVVGGSHLWPASLDSLLGSPINASFISC